MRLNGAKFLKNNHLPAILQALAAAVLFGMSAPLAKLLLGEMEPIPLAALLYLGSGLGVLGVKLLQGTSRRERDREAPLVRGDMKWLVGAALAGGVAAPIVLLFSLKNTPAGTASLLLNFEGVATALIALIAFREAISRRAWLAIVIITVACIALSLDLKAEWGFAPGALGILGACALWGLDNNFTRNISAKDPLSIVIVKGLSAGSFSLILSLILGQHLPSLDVTLKALLLGGLSYGASIVLFIQAMRGLGAARTSAFFSTAPVAGVLLSAVIFREPTGWMVYMALPLMVLGALLLINEQHAHTHTHEALTHEHAHRHDDGHHDHFHADGYALVHSHPHTHTALTHTHDHMPDLHHRHAHPNNKTGQSA